jgi:hypothetical protein
MPRLGSTLEDSASLPCSSYNRDCYAYMLHHQALLQLPLVTPLGQSLALCLWQGHVVVDAMAGTVQAEVLHQPG